MIGSFIGWEIGPEYQLAAGPGAVPAALRKLTAVLYAVRSLAPLLYQTRQAPPTLDD
jgi:hypothetical protein